METLNEDLITSYGEQEVLPRFLKDAVLARKRFNVEEIIHCNKQKGRLLMHIFESTRSEEANMRAGMPPHILKVYEGRGLAFTLKLLGLARPDAVPILEKKLKFGFTVPDGEGAVIEPLGFWTKMDFHDDQPDKSGKNPNMSNKKCRPSSVDSVERRHRRPFEAKRICIPNDTWCEEEDVQEMYDQARTMVEKGLWKCVSYPESQPAIAFAVKQRKRGGGWKIRTCIDMRFHNEFLLAKEKMRLLGTRASREIIQLCLSASPGRNPTLFQGKRDVNNDMRKELRRLKGLIENPIIPANERNIDVGLHPNEQDFDFVPGCFCRDFESYYYQFAVSDPTRNAIAIPVPHAITNDGTKKRRWVIVESLVAVFGSLSSVYEACGMSEVHMCIAVEVLLLIVLIYVDDAHAYDRQNAIPSSSALFDLYLALGNWPQSIGKQEDSCTQKSLISLGLAYEISEISVTISIPLEKRERCLALMKKIIDDTNRGATVFKDILSVRGLFRHIHQGCRVCVGAVRALDAWADESTFRQDIRKRLLRMQLVATLMNMSQRVKDMLPLTIAKKTVNLINRHLYTDASLEEGVAKIGGFLPPSNQSEVPLFFSITVKHIPQWVIDEHHDIQLWEIIAADLAQNEVFPAELAGFFTIHHIDNASDTYALVKGTTNNRLSQSVLSRVVLKATDPVYYAWISTHRNTIADATTRDEKLKIILQEFPDAVERAVSELAIPWDEYKNLFDKLIEVGMRPAAAKRRKITHGC